MAAQTEEIAGLVESVIRPLIDNPDDLVIDARETEDGSIFVEVRVNEEDAGKVIGRQGRVIKAIRTLARAAASSANTHVDVELLD
ncbi:KH domain-containing protein [uncultured Senegalimassilia sp.]|uniref:KH domain-containing protein n=1 Tax=uncultured Senegalimassilia sp. TaxID=1714350 RepID=UPI0025E5FB12|nr:KH domain-containing protein [uncultured Senegalimassilia sp.]